jgi:D-alanyl-D-alanine carboxypeptidase/D-alanyl-D-alanine-endopeptidase (penicillin-binding protein 4)
LGTATVRAHVDTIVGVDPVDLKVVDGSGLSVHNLATPRSLVQLLRYAHARPWGSLYKAMLAQPGEEGSTLSERLLELRGRLFAKTGSLTNVGSLVGYVTDRSGREIVFAVIVNGANLPAAAVREGIDAVVLGLAGN